MKVSPVKFLIVTLFVPLLLSGRPSSPQITSNSVRKVVIDAGHGGKDPGTSYKSYQEKDIVLSVALKLGGLIEANFRDVEVVYTRKTDIYPTVASRGELANKVGADLFISIHVNGVENTSARGTETFVMGPSSSDRNLAVVMRENDVVMYEKDYQTRYQGYVPGSEESYIIFSLMQYAYRDQSMQLAEIIQKHYTKELKAPDRGARQEPFLVLWNTAMPAVLTELGFISNSEDRKYLTTDRGQAQLARCLFNAFSEYKSRIEGRSNVVQLNSEAQSTAACDQSVQYYVQIATLSKQKSLRSNDFRSFKGQVTERRSANGSYRYFVGGVATYAEAEKLLAKVKKEFRDAFLVAFEGDTQLSIPEARKRTDN